MRKRKICKNQDNDYVNGRGGEEIPDFVPTRDELLQLLNYWVKEALDYEYFDCLFIPYAWRRVDRIGELLGEERAKKAVEEAYAEFGKDKDQRDWEIFMHDSSKDRKALQDQLQREMDDGTRS